MVVFRIHNRALPALDATAAALYGARWNPQGSPVVYAACTYEGAILEQLVHAGIGRLPANRVVSTIRIPDDAPREEVSALPDEAWTDLLLTQSIGEEWLQEKRSLILVVPSAVARPLGRNVLINPEHPDFPRVEVIDESPVSWDPRLLG